MKTRKFFPGQIILLLTICMTGLVTLHSPAAENRSRITEIRLNISSDIEAGADYGEIQVTAKSSHFSVGDVEIQNDIDYEWEVGTRPKAKVWLYADSNYYFHSSSSSLFHFTGEDTDFVSAHTEDDKTVMVLTFRLDKLEGDLEIDEVEWEHDNAIGYWSDSYGAASYQVRLYRNGSSVTSAMTIYDTYYDFSRYITRTGDYTFRVRASSRGSSRGEWVESDDLHVDRELLREISEYAGSDYSTDGTWQQNGIGWWYRYHNGSWPANTWKFINNHWYFFKSDGYMGTGWILWNNVWYYCDQTTGAMWANTRTPDGYTVGHNGEWLGY